MTIFVFWAKGIAGYVLAQNTKIGQKDAKFAVALRVLVKNRSFWRKIRFSASKCPGICVAEKQILRLKIYGFLSKRLNRRLLKSHEKNH